jgi:DNA invertase Pin-like site-specific DNA recombinase
VSTDEQTTAQQRDALIAAGCHVIFQDEAASGADRDRPGLRSAISELRQGDILVIARLDRLARSASHLLQIAEDLRARGCDLQSLHENIDTSTASGKLMFTMLAAFAEFELNVIRERTKERLAAKKRRGERVGRKPKLNEHDVAAARTMLEAGHSAAYVAGRLRCGRATLYRALAKSPASVLSIVPGRT